MNSLIDYLRIAQSQSGAPTPSYDGIFLEGHGPPTDATPRSYLFYGNGDSGKIYINASRSSEELRPSAKIWLEILDSSLISVTDEQEILAVTT